MDGKKVRKEQELYIIKHNELIRAIYDMTAQQQKIVAYAVSKIKYHDKPGQWYEISIEDLCHACGLVMDDTGYYYKSIKEDIRKITKRIWIRLPDRREITFSWFSDAEIVPLSGTVYIKFHERLDDLLFLLNGNYTQYQLIEIAPFQSKYTIRLYEYFKMIVKKDKLDTMGEDDPIRFTVSELRELLAVEGYSRWAEFKRNVIDRAINEINTYSDIFHVSYETYKKGKNVESIYFLVKRPSGIQIMNAHQAERERMAMQRKPTEKTRQKKEKVKELTERRKEIETRLLNPSFEVLTESTRELVEINKELEALIPGEKARKAEGGQES